MSSHVRTHIYADGRAREMDYAYAAPDRQMGCSPLGRMISKVIKKCNGRRGRTRHEHLDYAMAHPHAQTHYVRPDARTVTYTTTSNLPSSHAMPAQQPPVHGPYGPAAGAPPRADGKPRKRKKSKSKSKHVRFNTPGPGPGPPPNAADAYQHQHAPPAAGTSGDAVYGDQHQHHAAASHAYAPAPQGQGHGHGYGYGRYAPSPLTRWEMLGAGGTPRRHEYFSGEYRWYYPTPVREGIYSMATDANRLTAIFSEENPNACTIV
ncbi:uncharacterized protein [Aegilops tauschii subsp. strangulata]|uniref:Uncharacterized protein n=1 Tax=Aegilops tauschii subsp. strangulata TaxID=200361 RepID=A0A453RG86_AEGTS|nr:uncharacterized protein LOC109743272 [Aegilops tauschii subsp. strangulata]